MTEKKDVGKWYDGIPTQEGRYLLYCSNGTEDYHFNKLERKGDKLEWRYNWIGEIIAYMPIEER